MISGVWSIHTFMHLHENVSELVNLLLKQMRV